MKKLIMIMTVVAGVAAFAECEAKQEAKACGCTVEKRAKMSVKERAAFRREARAKEAASKVQ